MKKFFYNSIDLNLVIICIFTLILFATKIVLLPQSIIEWDEAQYALGVDHFNILLHQPHPPGFPVWIMFGKVLKWLFPSTPSYKLLLIGGSFFSSFIAIPTYFFVNEICRNHKLALITAILFPLVPAVMFYGSSAFTTLPSFFFGILFALFYAPPPTKSPYLKLIGSVCLAISIGIRPYMGFAFAPLYIFGLFVAYREKKINIIILFYVLPLAVTSCLWFIPMIISTNGFSNWYNCYTQHIHNASGFILTPLEKLFALTKKNCFFWKVWGPYPFSFILTSISLLSVVYFLKNNCEKKLFFIIFTSGIIFSNIFIHTLHHLRYSAPMIFIMVIGLAYILLQISRKNLYIAIVLGGILLSYWIIFITPTITSRASNKSPIDQAFKFLDKQLSKNSGLKIWFDDLNFTPHIKYLRTGENHELPNLQKQLTTSRLYPIGNQNLSINYLNKELGSESLMLRTGFSLIPDEDMLFGNHTLKFFKWPTSRIKWFLQWGGRYCSTSVLQISLIHGNGWYSLEGDSTHQQRWINKKASVFFLNNKPKTNQWQIDLTYYNSPRSSKNKLSIFINNTLIATKNILKNGQNIFCHLPFTHDLLLPQWNKLTLVSEKTFVPTGPDNRRLGILVKQIRITPKHAYNNN